MTGAFRRMFRRLHRLLKGPALVRAADRNARAADRLDAALRELLKQ